MNGVKNTSPRRVAGALLASTLVLGGAAFPAFGQGAAPSKPASAPKAAPGSKPGSRLAILPGDIKTPKLPEFKPQQPVRVALPNGMVIFLQEDHELPLIEGTAVIRGGGREAPAAKAGLAGIYAASWRTGGTKTKTGDQLDDYLEVRAARVESGGDVDSTTLSFSALKEDFEDVFAVFDELLRQPEFRDDKVALAKQQAATAISRRNDEIGAIAQREATKLAYGADNPYAREAEYWTVAAVERQDLLDWHKKFVHPNNILIGVEGDFDAAQMEARLRKAFASWPKGPAAEKVKVDFKDPRPGYHFIAKDDVNQSTIHMVTLGTTKDNPDYYAITVMNELFGGGLGARLFSNVRSKKGLAYGVGGGLGTGWDHPAVFRIAMGTKSSTTAAGLDALYAEIDGLIKDPGSAEEVRKAKDSILNSFIFNFDSAGKVLRERMRYEYYGYPADFLERFRSGIEKITPADIARVVKKYVDRNKFAVLVVGKAADFDRPLSSFGPVTTLDITIRDEAPGAAGKAAEAEAPKTSNPEGRALMAKVVAALGGKAKLASVKSLSQKSSQTLQTPQGEMSAESEVLTILPDRVQQVRRLPFGEMKVVLTPEAAFMSMGGQTQDMPSNMKEDALKDLRREPLVLAQNADDPGYVFIASGTEKVGDTTASILDITGGGVSVRWHVDGATGRIVRGSYKASTPAGPAQREIDYADYRTVDGVTLPHKRTVRDNGKESQKSEIKELKINPAVDPKIFAKPGA